MEAIKIDKKSTLMISDGGNLLNEIDHTYPAFLASCNKNYDGILSFIRFTKDRVIVCSRNRTLEELVNKKIHISRSNYEDLLKVGFNKPYTTVTKLEDVLNLCQRYNKKIYLNICQPIGHLELKQLTSLLKKYYIRNITIIVNEESILNYFKNFHKDFHLALDVDRIDEDVINICEHNNFDIIIPMDRFSKRTVDLLHKHNIKVGIREISNPIDASTVVNNNVDFFFTKELE